MLPQQAVHKPDTLSTSSIGAAVVNAHLNLTLQVKPIPQTVGITGHRCHVRCLNKLLHKSHTTCWPLALKQQLWIQPGCYAVGQTQWTKPLASQATPATSSQPVAASTAGVPFTASASFAGLRPGYVFKSGSEGVGYYLDQGPTSIQGV